ncbi:MAG: flagellar motor switch protein FliG [Betaproteobacteria bacterium]|nr:flagellar motor switch protein FliG [Betaproteobacteria bacterium]
MSDDGVNRAAVLLMTLGEEASIEVFKYLGPKEVQKLGMEMAKISSIPRERLETVLTDFRLESERQDGIHTDSDEYIRNVLTKALGTDKAGALIDRILSNNDNAGIESLKWMDAGSVAELIKNEHPQIIATILVHLDADQASDILKSFTERQRNDVMLRIATLEGVQPSALRDLNEVLTQLLTGGERLKKSSMGGVDVAAEILNFMGGQYETSITEFIKESDADLAQKIQDKMFVFENLLELDDRSIQLLLREVQSETLVVALKGTSEPLKEKIFKNMSSRAAEMLREDLEAKGPVRLSEVESEQKEILKIVRRLADEGQIVMGSKGGDEGLVE